MRALPTPILLSLIHAFEGKNGKPEATRTQDPAGNWEIGWSHKLSGPDDIYWDETLTPEAADTLALQDLQQFGQHVCDELGDRVDTLTQGQYAALIDLTYNIGPMNFSNSTVLRLVKQGSYNAVPNAIRLWDKDRENGELVVSNGLVRRRAAEVAVWLHG